MALFGLVTRREHQRLEAELNALKASKYAPWQLATAEAERFNLPDPGIYENQAALYRRLSWVLAAVQAVANDAALVEFSVSKLQANEEARDITNHPFEQLLRRPNPMDSRFEFLYATVAMKRLNGNAYWWLNRTSELEQPNEMWFIPPHMIRPVPDGRMYLRGYLYTPGDGQEIALEPWEIVHFRSFNPFSRFVGLSAIESLALIAAGDIGMQSWNTKLFAENNARLPGILTFAEMIQDAQWEDIKAQTREASKKRELMMLRGTGSGAINWLQNAVSQKDMEFLAGRQANKEEIWSVLAPGLAAMLDPNATEANARAGRATFNDRAVYPELVAMQEKVTLQLLPAYGENLVGEFEDIRYTDRALELQEQEAYAKTHTVKEVRAEYYNDKPLGDDRDDLFPVQINAQTGDGTEKPIPPALQPFQQNGQPQPGQPIPPQTGEDGQPQQKPEEPTEPASKAVAEELARWERKAIKRIGKQVDFISDIIPANLQAQVRAGLPECKSAEDVRTFFALKVARLDRKEIAAVSDNKVEILELAAAINRAAEKDAQKAEVVTGPPVVVNTTSNVGDEMTRMFSDAFTGFMEQFAASIRSIPAPVINVAAPRIRPPDVVVHNDVKMPKEKRRIQRVQRDSSGDMTGAVTEIEYEE